MKKLILMAVAALFAGTVDAQELNNFNFGGRAKPIVSPEVVGDSVTFRLNANYATQVLLSGNWMPMGQTVALKKGTDGIWQTTLKAPYAEIYTYNFIVDGVSTNDPQNFMIQRDGTRYLNMLMVLGERSSVYNESTKRGTVEHRWYDSQSLGINRRMTVYLPYGYEANPKKKYPVLYLLHGGGGDEEAWTSMGRTAQILDNLIEQGKAEPMIVVMPNGNPNQQAASTMGLPTITLDTRAPENANAYVKSLVNEIVPFIEKNYRAIPKKSARAIAGLSMGGGHTTSATILFPNTFDYICPMSCGIRESDHLDADLQGIKKAGYKLYWVGCGNDDFAMPGTKILDAALTRNGMEHTLFTSDGGHEWKNWRLYLQTFAQLLFK
ncbi:MAG: alpha/beta hydrolase-fold protein [Bacteroidales bacterium]|nr:alpha/beta hydrolase-fold protein [Bacteroidales bacterium]